MRKPIFGVSRPGSTQTRFDTNRAVQSFWIWEAEGLYYLCNENNGADIIRSYCATDLRLCFRICETQVFS